MRLLHMVGILKLYVERQTSYVCLFCVFFFFFPNCGLCGVHFDAVILLTTDFFWVITWTLTLTRLIQWLVN